MTLQRFLVVAFLVFLLGMGLLYAGVNRVPFRHNGSHEMHKSSLTVDGVASNYSSVNLAITTRDSVEGLKQLAKKGVDTYDKI